MALPLHLNRDDIAAILGPRVSTEQIRKNERHWGLDKARVDFNARCVLYRTEAALRILESRGFDLPNRNR